MLAVIFGMYRFLDVERCWECWRRKKERVVVLSWILMNNLPDMDIDLNRKDKKDYF